MKRYPLLGQVTCRLSLGIFHKPLRHSVPDWDKGLHQFNAANSGKTVNFASYLAQSGVPDEDGCTNIRWIDVEPIDTRWLVRFTNRAGESDSFIAQTLRHAWRYALTH